MSLEASMQQIYVSSQKLLTRWEILRETWNDPLYASIDAKFMIPLDREIRSAIVVAERMHEILCEAIEELATHDDAPYGEKRSRKASIE